MQSKTIIKLFTITFAILLGTISPVEAAEWRFDPVFRVAADFDDNPFLSIRTDIEESASGYIAEGSIRIAYRSETANFFIEPKLRTSSYDSDPSLDTDDQFLRFDWNRYTESSNFRFRGNYSRESTRTAERAGTDLSIEDPDEFTDDDSGRVALLGHRERLNLVPSFSYDISNESTLSLSLNYTDTSYDEVFANLLTDYTDTRVNVGYTRAMSERTDLIVIATARNYQTDRGDNEVKGIGLNAGFNRQLSETSRLRAIVGVEDTELAGGESDVNPVADISYVRILKTVTILAQYRRTIAASGSGDLATRDSINLNFTRNLSDRVSAGMGARIYSTNALDVGPGIFDERNYVQLLSQITWHLSPVFSLQADYRYTFIDRESFGESSNSNQITLWFSYHPTAIRRSR